MVELTPDKRKKYHRKALSIWGRLVKEWDKPDEKEVSKKYYAMMEKMYNQEHEDIERFAKASKRYRNKK
jgi:hypothetical protein